MLPHAAFRELGAAAVLGRLVDRLGLPLMVKPARGGSALGCTAVDKAEDLPAAMVQCFSYGEAALVERFVAGTEVAVTVVDTGDGPRALPAVEVRPLSGVYDYAARYTAGATEYFAPARLADDGRRCRRRGSPSTPHTALGLRDLSRVDALVDADGARHLLEVNVAPGMTETSLLPMAVDAAGLSFGALLRAAARAGRRPQLGPRGAGACPGGRGPQPALPGGRAPRGGRPAWRPRATASPAGAAPRSRCCGAPPSAEQAPSGRTDRHEEQATQRHEHAARERQDVHRATRARQPGSTRARSAGARATRPGARATRSGARRHPYRRCPRRRCRHLPHPSRQGQPRCLRHPRRPGRAGLPSPSPRRSRCRCRRCRRPRCR